MWFTRFAGCLYVHVAAPSRSQLAHTGRSRLQRIFLSRQRVQARSLVASSDCENDQRVDFICVYDDMLRTCFWLIAISCHTPVAKGFLLNCDLTRSDTT
jgi:hypothetical protein